MQTFQPEMYGKMLDTCGASLSSCPQSQLPFICTVAASGFSDATEGLMVCYLAEDSEIGMVDSLGSVKPDLICWLEGAEDLFIQDSDEEKGLTATCLECFDSESDSAMEAIAQKDDEV
ncbi:hypothetical protein JD844_013588 [Phrynosoma platyrhinos]|uniref:Uncharacterized protein n=1 Tax=Phrynosoma platyrhinos TaxID=52577 RepID=A0ABQ7TM20_PHRPL|nr:hypothetical protein JD844_013588 [Phrynosoma platyrhinos]